MNQPLTTFMQSHPIQRWLVTILMFVLFLLALLFLLIIYLGHLGICQYIFGLLIATRDAMPSCIQKIHYAVWGHA